MSRLTAPISEELRVKHPEQYEAINNKEFPKKLPNFVIKFFDAMENLTDKPVEWLLKIRKGL